MSVILVDGFDTYNGGGLGTGLNARWTGTTSGASMATGRFGGQCFNQASGSTVDASRALASSPSSFACGFAFKETQATPSATPIPVAFASAGTYQVGFRVNSDFSLSALRLTARGTVGAVLGTTAANVLVLSTWHYIEFEITISDTVGVFNIYVDGVSKLALTGQDTRNGTPTTVDTISIGSQAGTGGATFQIDDLYVTDSARLGERRVETIYPTSDVAQGFARSTGATNYTLVDEAQANGDTDYVQGSSVGDVDTYGFGDLSSTPTAIDAVNNHAYAEKTDAASRSIALQVKSGATTSDGSNFVLLSSYGRFDRLLTTDPNTSAAWTASAVNALQGGPKVTV